MGRLRCRYCDQSLGRRAEQWGVQTSLAIQKAVVNWVAEGFPYLQSHPEMTEKSFSVCGIITHNPQKVRNDEFLRSLMQNVNEKIHEKEEGLIKECDEDPFYNM